MRISLAILVAFLIMSCTARNAELSSSNYQNLCLDSIYVDIVNDSVPQLFTATVNELKSKPARQVYLVTVHIDSNLVITGIDGPLADIVLQSKLVTDYMRSKDRVMIKKRRANAKCTSYIMFVRLLAPYGLISYPRLADTIARIE